MTTSRDAGPPLPAPILPDAWKRGMGYAHGMTARGRIVTTAGEIGWDPITNLIASDDLATQAAQALRNVVAILHAAGAGPEHVVRLTWYITSRDEYLAAGSALGLAYRAAMGSYYPAMSVVVVAALLEPRAKVEIEATAIVPE